MAKWQVLIFLGLALLVASTVAAPAESLRRSLRGVDCNTNICISGQNKPEGSAPDEPTPPGEPTPPAE